MKPSLEDVLARRVRELAEAKELPISHLADRCGLARSYVWRLLAAESSATLSVVQRLADVLEVDPIELITWTKEEPRTAPTPRLRAVANKKKRSLRSK